MAYLCVTAPIQSLHIVRWSSEQFSGLAIGDCFVLFVLFCLFPKCYFCYIVLYVSSVAECSNEHHVLGH